MSYVNVKLSQLVDDESNPKQQTKNVYKLVNGDYRDLGIIKNVEVGMDNITLDVGNGEEIFIGTDTQDGPNGDIILNDFFFEDNGLQGGKKKKARKTRKARKSSKKSRKSRKSSKKSRKSRKSRK